MAIYDISTHVSSRCQLIWDHGRFESARRPRNLSAAVDVGSRQRLVWRVAPLAWREGLPLCRLVYGVADALEVGEIREGRAG